MTLSSRVQKHTHQCKFCFIVFSSARYNNLILNSHEDKREASIVIEKRLATNIHLTLNKCNFSL